MKFVQKTLYNLAKLFQNEMVSEEYSLRNGLLQNIDTRLKIISILIFLIISGASGSFYILAMLNVIALLLCAASGIRPGFMLKRVWLFIPLIATIVSMPAALNIFIPGEHPILFLYRGEFSLFISAEGLLAVAKMVLRIGTSITFGFLLIMTTRWTHLVRALRALGLPKLFTMMLDITYRYIFVILRIGLEIFEARYLRTVGEIDNKTNRSFVSSTIANLFNRSYVLGEELYTSMVCRGYAGEPVSLKEFRFGRQDAVWAGCMAVLLTILGVGGILFG